MNDTIIYANWRTSIMTNIFIIGNENMSSNKILFIVCKHIRYTGITQYKCFKDVISIARYRRCDV
jgi:hypothetical protein